jgi:hypothetical protein
MARNYGSYSPVIPVNVAWEESIELTDEDDVAIDLTGYDVRAQIYADYPVRDPDTGLAETEPVLELTTADYYAVAPAWPVVEGWSVPTPTNGILLLQVLVEDLWQLNETNQRRIQYVWDVQLVNDAGYSIPVVSGKPIVKRGVTL